MLPTWLANDWANAFSVCVLVSAGELANRASICFGDRPPACAGSSIRRMYQPTNPRSPARPLVQVVVVEEEGRGVGPLLAPRRRCRRC